MMAAFDEPTPALALPKNAAAYEAQYEALGGRSQIQSELLQQKRERFP